MNRRNRKTNAHSNSFSLPPWNSRQGKLHYLPLNGEIITFEQNKGKVHNFADVNFVVDNLLYKCYNLEKFSIYIKDSK